MFLVSNTQTTTLHKVRAHTYIDCNEKADALIKLEHVQKAKLCRWLMRWGHLVAGIDWATFSSGVF